MLPRTTIAPFKSLDPPTLNSDETHARDEVEQGPPKRETDRTERELDRITCLRVWNDSLTVIFPVQDTDDPRTVGNTTENELPNTACPATVTRAEIAADPKPDKNDPITARPLTDDAPLTINDDPFKDSDDPV